MEEKLYSTRLYCEICNIQFVNRTKLREHNNVIHEAKPFRCEICHKNFGERFSLKVHYRIHTGEKPHVCSYCNKSFTQACNLSTHKKRYHFRKLNQGREMNVSSKFLPNHKKSRPDEVRVQSFPCPHCKIVFRRIEHVKAHILSTHIKRTTLNGGSNSRSPSTSSGVSSSSCNSEGMARGAVIKQEHLIANGGRFMHCKKCKLTFPDRVSYQKHMFAHAKQQEQVTPQRSSPSSAIQVSNSSGEKINLRELVSKIKTKRKEQEVKPQNQEEVMQKLSGLGMEISLHPLRKSQSTANDLGLVISSVQSVSQSFFDDMEKPKARPASGVEQVIKEESPTARRLVLRSNGSNGATEPPPKQESRTPDPTNDDRDPLELPTASSSTTSSTDLPKLKKPKIEPDDIILSSTRRTSRAVAYNEADQPKYLSIIYKQKNGKTSKRRIFPCGQCTCKFENIETRKMHFMTVHGSSVKSRKTPEHDPLEPEIIPAFEDHEMESGE